MEQSAAPERTCEFRFYSGKRKKEVYIPGRLLTNKGLIWNVPSVVCEWARLVKIRLIWIFRAKYYLIAGCVLLISTLMKPHWAAYVTNDIETEIDPVSRRCGGPDAVAAPRMPSQQRNITWRDGQAVEFRPSEALAASVRFWSPLTFPFPTLTNCFSNADDTKPGHKAMRLIIYCLVLLIDLFGEWG